MLMCSTNLMPIYTEKKNLLSVHKINCFFDNTEFSDALKKILGLFLL